MIRSWAILAIILTSFLVAVPNFTPEHSPNALAVHHQSQPYTIGDPNATTAALNYTYSQQNLFTDTTANPLTPTLNPSVAAPGTSFQWLSSATETKTNTPIPGSGFIFNSTAPTSTGKQTLNWTMIIPEFNCKGCSKVNVQFDFFGNITKGTSANYTLTTTSAHTPIGSGNFGTTLGAFHPSTNGCLEDVCVDVTPYRGYNVTLLFSFGWQNITTAHGMFAELGRVTVAASSSPSHSSSNFMQLDPTNSSRVIHTTDFASIIYNNTLTTLFHPGSGNLTKNWWQTEGFNIFYPAGYRFKQVYINDSAFIPSSNEVALESRNCVSGTGCSQSVFAMNVSDFAIISHNSTITIITNTDNSITQLSPLSGGVPSTIFAPGDTISLKTTIKPSVSNASVIQQIGKLDVIFSDRTNTTRILTGDSFPTLTSTGSVYNVTLPADCSGNNCGRWSIRANFNSSYDLGVMSSSFRIEQMQISSFSSSGSNTALNVQGSLTYSNGSAAPTASGLVFAVDAGSTVSYPTVPNTNTASVGLYVTNVTLVNGVFSQGQTLIMTFTIVNSNSSAPPYNANVTIEHDWPGTPPKAHGMNANFTLGAGDLLGDLPFTRGPQSYSAAFTITGSGIHLVITSLSTGNFRTIPMSLGTDPVSPTEQHTGLFKITVVTTSNKAVVSTTSTNSPPYAYVFGLPLAPGKYLAYSTPFAGTSFSTTFTSNAILGAKRLVVFALARDSSGIVLTNTPLNPGFTDSTTLQSTMDQIGEVATSQQATATLHLTSNSTTLSQNLTVNLNLQGQSVPVATTNLVITHGDTQTVSFSFTTPSTPGQYTLSFSSPQYNNGAALASQTLKVTLLQSNLQILIPAAIGVVAAIIVLGVYMIRRQPTSGSEEVTRKSPGGPKPKPSGSGNAPAKSLTQTTPLMV